MECRPSFFHFPFPLFGWGFKTSENAALVAEISVDTQALDGSRLEDHFNLTIDDTKTDSGMDTERRDRVRRAEWVRFREERRKHIPGTGSAPGPENFAPAEGSFNVPPKS